MAKAPKVSPHALDAAWGGLLSAALVGTRHHPFAPLPGFTPALGGEADAPEKQLLLTAANLRVVQRAGRCPTTGPATRYRSLPEHWPAAPAAATGLLRGVLARAPYEDAWSQAVVGSLKLLHATRRRVPYPLLPALLDALEPHYRAGQLARYAPIVGNLGRDLAWRHASAEVREQARLIVGPPYVLDSVLLVTEECRLAGPASLARVLARLPRAEYHERADLLELLTEWSRRVPLPPEAESALAALLPEAENQWHIQRLLVAMPGSALAELAWAQTSPWLTVGRDAAGVLSLHIEPPTGVELYQSPFHRPGNSYSSSGWLVDHTSVVAPRRWLAAWQLTPAAAVTLAEATYDGRELLYRWQLAAWLHRDYELAPLLYTHALTRGPNFVGAELLALLPEATQAEWALACLPGPDAPSPLHNGSCVVRQWAVTRLPTLLLALQRFTHEWLHAPADALPDQAADIIKGFLDQLTYQGDPTLLPFVAGLPPAPQVAEQLARTHQVLAHYRDLTASLAVA